MSREGGGKPQEREVTGAERELRRKGLVRWHMLLKCPVGEDRLCPVSVGSGSWRLSVTLTRRFLRGEDRSQGKASLGVNGR